MKLLYGSVVLLSLLPQSNRPSSRILARCLRRSQEMNANNWFPIGLWELHSSICTERTALSSLDSLVIFNYKYPNEIPHDMPVEYHLQQTNASFQYLLFSTRSSIYYPTDSEIPVFVISFISSPPSANPFDVRKLGQKRGRGEVGTH
jgi:hypothetical protein